MPVTLEAMLAKLPPAQRAKIERRAAVLIAEERARQHSISIGASTMETTILDAAVPIKRRTIRHGPAAVDKLIGTVLRARRTALGLTQHEIAALVGVTYQQAHKYEAGQNRIGAGRFLALSHHLGIDLNALREQVLAGQSGAGPAQVSGLRSKLEIADILGRLDARGVKAVLGIARAMDPERSGDG